MDQSRWMSGSAMVEMVCRRAPERAGVAVPWAPKLIYVVEAPASLWRYEGKNNNKGMIESINLYRENANQAQAS